MRIAFLLTRLRMQLGCRSYAGMGQVLARRLNAP